MRLYSGTSNRLLAEKISNNLNLVYNTNDHIDGLIIERFSDGEILPKFVESIRDQDIFFVQSTNTCEALMETLFVQDAAKRAGCRSFTLIAPFQGYSRQDKTDHLRSSIGSKVVADIITKIGLSQLITIDLHSSSIQGFYDVPVIHLNGNMIFTKYVKSLGLDNLVILSPDQGAVKKNNDFARAFPGSSFAVINKKRIKPNEIHSMELIGDVKGKNVIMVDDISDTFGTIKKASELIMESGAQSVRAVATHGVLSGNAIQNLESSPIAELIVSDSINITKSSDKLKVISCDFLISNVIHRLLKGSSISEINNIEVTEVMEHAGPVMS